MVSMSLSIPHSWRMLLYWGWRANHSFSLTRVISASQSFSFASVPSFPVCWQNEWRTVLGLSFSFHKIKTLKKITIFPKKIVNLIVRKLIESRKRRLPLVQRKETRLPPTNLSFWIVYNHKSLCKRYGLSTRFSLLRLSFLIPSETLDTQAKNITKKVMSEANKPERATPILDLCHSVFYGPVYFSVHLKELFLAKMEVLLRLSAYLNYNIPKRKTKTKFIKSGCQ